MGIFGWSYPPGAEHDPNAPYNQTDECQYCGKDAEDCECPWCEHCENYEDECSCKALEDEVTRRKEDRG